MPYSPLDPRRVGLSQRMAADLVGLTSVTINRAVAGRQLGQAREQLAALVAALEPLDEADRAAYVARVQDLGAGIVAVLVAALERMATPADRDGYLARIRGLLAPEEAAEDRQRDASSSSAANSSRSRAISPSAQAGRSGVPGAGGRAGSG
jgi:hypothetical protein